MSGSLRERDEMRRNHLARQFGLKMSAERRIRRRRSVADHIGHEPRFPAGQIITQLHDGVAHVGKRFKRPLDFRQFDAMAAKLHLVIAPPDKFDDAVRPPPRQIPGPIEALAVAERIRQNYVGGKPRAGRDSLGQALRRQ